MIDWDDLDLAFQFVNSAPFGVNAAYINREDGQTFLESGFGDSEDMPEDIGEDPKYVLIPHKNDLDLGIKLVRRFVAEHLPEKFDDVQNMFRRKGAYSKYRDLLHSHGLQESWYEFEEKETRIALREWCVDNDISLREDKDDGTEPQEVGNS